MIVSASMVMLTLVFTSPDAGVHGGHRRPDAVGDMLAWLATVLPTYGTFRYAMVMTSPVAHAERRIMDVRAAGCVIVVHGILRSQSVSDVENSVSLADLPADSVTVMRQTGTTVSLGTAVGLRYDPPFWEVATMAPETARLVVVRAMTTGRVGRLPVFALYLDTEAHADAVAAALRDAIRQCRSPR